MSIRRERRQDNQSVNRSRAFAGLVRDFRDQKIDRRSFLAKISTLLTVTAVPLFSGAEIATGPGPELSMEPWLTFAAVQNHLFPSTVDAPGTREINATAWLRRVLSESHTDPDDKEFINNGVGWLNGIAQEKQGKKFYQLDHDQREAVLRQIEKSNAGERWLALILLYIFEALLSAPVYGGNPDGIGWLWLEHQGGFPLPPAEKTYFKL